MAQTPSDLLRAVLADGPDTAPSIVLSEGTDARVVAGALAAQDAGIARVILVGPVSDVQAHLDGRADVEIHDPATSDLTDEFAATYLELRRHKGVDEAAAQKAARDPLVYAAMMVRHGHAAGTVGGAVATTSDVVRAALQVIGKAPEAAMVSSFFLMLPPDGAGRAMLYSDCGLVIDPSAEELSAIAQASAVSCRAMLREEPRIAMLSFSTMGSARHPKVSKVQEATALLRTARPELNVDGELQFDAAFVPSVGASKAPGSQVAGQANVMVFPNLDAGNIAYKITQRLGGYTAIGPILQGLAHPANDLSRGCVAGDVTQMIAVTGLQHLARRGTGDVVPGQGG